MRVLFLMIGLIMISQTMFSQRRLIDDFSSITRLNLKFINVIEICENPPTDSWKGACEEQDSVTFFMLYELGITEGTVCFTTIREKKFKCVLMPPVKEEDYIRCTQQSIDDEACRIVNSVAFDSICNGCNEDDIYVFSGGRLGTLTRRQRVFLRQNTSLTRRMLRDYNRAIRSYNILSNYNNGLGNQVDIMPPVLRN